MKTAVCLIACLIGLLVGAATLLAPAMVAAAEPRITFTADQEPLGFVLDSIAAQTGYHFKIDRRWEDHPVSATITNLPLEQGLKRLLRSLNHTIIWESDNRVTIMVFGKADPLRQDGAISHGAPPQEEMPEIEAPPAGEESSEAATETADTTESDEARPDETEASAGEPDREPGDEPRESEPDSPESPEPPTAQEPPVSD